MANGVELVLSSHNPLVPGSSPGGPTTLKGYILETSFTVCTGHIVNTLGPNGLGPGSRRQLSISKYPRS
jgi:hypothetical protein